MSTNSDDNTLVKHKDYQDPESPTQRDPLTPVTSAVTDIDHTAVIDTDDTVQISERQTQGTADIDQP